VFLLLQLQKWSFDHCINWVCSEVDVDEELPKGSGSLHRSAGTKDHPLSTGKAYPYIWKFFDDRGADKNQSPPHQSYVGKEKKPEQCNYS